MIINLRGTSGSGKTTAMRGIMAMGRTEKLYAAGNSRVQGYAVYDVTKLPILIAGPYESRSGGCDGIKTPDEVCDRVRAMNKLGHVLFEGLLISHTFQRYYDLGKELGGMTIMFLDTPLEVCLQSVQLRRDERGDGRPWNLEHTASDWNANRRVFQKFKAAGADVRRVARERSVDEIVALLKSRDTEQEDYECEAKIRAVYPGTGGDAPAQRSKPERRPVQPRPDTGQLQLL